jgi:hypothetical protein
MMLKKASPLVQLELPDPLGHFCALVNWSRFIEDDWAMALTAQSAKLELIP